MLQVRVVLITVPVNSISFVYKYSECIFQIDLNEPVCFEIVGRIRSIIQTDSLILIFVDTLYYATITPSFVCVYCVKPRRKTNGTL